MKIQNILTAVAFSLMAISCQTAEPETTPDSQVGNGDDVVKLDTSIPENIKDVEKDGHPWMLFTVDEIVDVKERANATAWTRALYNQMMADSERMMGESHIPFNFENGRMYSNGTAGRALTTLTMNLLFTGYMNGDMEQITRAKDIMLSAIRLTIPGELSTAEKSNRAEVNAKMAQGIPQKWYEHLQDGDAGYAMAMAYDMLYPFLTDAENQEYRDAMRDMAAWLSNANGDGYNSLYNKIDFSAMGCNHTSVHWGPVGLIALMLGEDDDKYDYFLNESKKFIQKFMTVASDKDGYMMEGHAYGIYGVSGVYPLAHALSRVSGADTEDWFTDYKDPYFLKYGDQLIWQRLPNDQVLVFNEANNESTPELQIMGALRYNNPVQLSAWLGTQGYTKTGKFPEIGYMSAYSRPFVFTVDPIEPVAASESNMTLDKHYESGRVFMRSGWGRSDAVVGFTSGRDYAYAHNQEDENQITLFALGNDFLFDPNYEARFNHCHSIPTIGGYNQLPDNSNKSTSSCHGVEGMISKFDNSRKYGAFIYGKAVAEGIDGAYAYKENDPQNPVKYFDRKAYFVRGTKQIPYLVFRDDMELNSGAEAECVARYITKPCNSIRKYSDGKSVIIEGGQAPGDALVMVYSGTTQVNLSEDNLSGINIATEANKQYTNGDVAASKYNVAINRYLKRITGKVTAVNPKFTTLVLPCEDSFDFPTVNVSGDADNVIYTITFKDGEVHKITLTKDDIDVVVE